MIPAAYALPRMRHIITWVAALLRRLAVERGAEVDTKPMRVNPSESVVKRRTVNPFPARHGTWYSCPELNRNPRFRKPLLYPFELQEPRANRLS